jgi:hypothetical protein
MARGKKHTAEQIVNLLRQVEVESAGITAGKRRVEWCNCRSERLEYRTAAHIKNTAAA